MVERIFSLSSPFLPGQKGRCKANPLWARSMEGVQPWPSLLPAASLALHHPEAVLHPPMFAVLTCPTRLSCFLPQPQGKRGPPGLILGGGGYVHTTIGLCSSSVLALRATLSHIAFHLRTFSLIMPGIQQGASLPGTCSATEIWMFHKGTGNR